MDHRQWHRRNPHLCRQVEPVDQEYVFRCKHFLMKVLLFEYLEIKVRNQILIQDWVVPCMIKITQG